MASKLLVLSVMFFHCVIAIRESVARPVATVEQRAPAATPVLKHRQNDNTLYRTHTFRPLAQYEYTGTNAPTVVASDLAISTDTANSVAVIVLGTSINSALNAVVSTTCPKLDSPQCPPSLYNATNPNEVSLKSRGIITAGAFLVVFLAILFGQLRLHRFSSGKPIEVAQGEFSELAALPSAPGVVFVTDSDDPNPVTVGPNGDMLGGFSLTSNAIASEATNTWSCMHRADSDNICTAIANGPGWCECNADGSTYAVTSSSGGWGCNYSTKPPSTKLYCPNTQAPTITQAPKSPMTSISGALTVTSYTGPGKGHEKGDIGVLFERDGGEGQIQSLLNGYGSCIDFPATAAPNKPRIKRDVDTITCCGFHTEDLMSTTVSGGYLEWIWTKIPPKGLGIPDYIDLYQKPVDNAYLVASSLSGLAKYTPEQISTAVKILFWVAIVNKVLKRTTDNADIVIPVSDLASTTKPLLRSTIQSSTRPRSTSAMSNCPDGLTALHCKNCGGEMGTSSCSGLGIKYLNKWSECPCYAAKVQPFTPFPNSAAYASATALNLLDQTMGAMSDWNHPTAAPLPDGSASATENHIPAGTGVGVTETGIPIPSSRAAPGGKYVITVRNYAMHRIAGTVFQVIKVAYDDGEDDDWLTYHNVYAPNWVDALYPGKVTIHTSGDMFTQGQKISIEVFDSEGSSTKFNEELRKEDTDGTNYCDPPGAWHPETDRYLAYRDVFCHVHVVK